MGGMSLKVLFVVTSFWAYGELIIAIEFAKEIKKYGHKPHFLIPPRHEKVVKSLNFPYTILIPKASKINRVLLKDIELRIKPEIIILSDFLNYHYCEKHYGININDLEIFSGKVGTFDNFHWELQREAMDTYGFNSNILKNTKIEDYGFKLAPCPIVNPHLASENNQFKYPLIQDFLPYNKDNKEKYRDELGLPKDKKIIMVTSATWQNIHGKYKGANEFISISDKIYESILSDLSKRYLILYIGDEVKYSLNNNIKRITSMATEDFDKYAMASDLYIGRNITSTSMIRLALSRIPCIMLMNSKFSKVGKDVYTYGYYMYPVGWYKFLKPLMEGNPYMDIISTVEQFDKSDVIREVEEMLFDEEKKERIGERIIELKKSLSSLWKPNHIVESILLGGFKDDKESMYSINSF